MNVDASTRAQEAAAGSPGADLALEGAQYAEAYLDRLHAGNAKPEELAVLCEFLRGEMLHAFCSAVHRALATIARRG